MTTQKLLSTQETEVLLDILRSRFDKNIRRHPMIVWADVEVRLMKNAERLWSLQQMDDTGGEPDVVGFDADSGAYIFYDCAPESPKGRRSLCYDAVALMQRKDYPPTGSAAGAAAAMGIQILYEVEYRHLQTLGNFDTKTSSWLHTPDEIRALGGAIFGDFRYGTVFIYHNGAQSYYGGRGFRGVLRV